GTDWVFTAFVARSRSRPDHKFDDADYLAYAYLGGPYLVIPFPTGTLDRDYDVSEKEAYSRVFQHEMGHIFWALDEYPGSPPCDFPSGYLNCPNLNSVHISPDGTVMGCPDFVPCMMLGVMATGRPVCEHTAGQMGVADSDGNSVPDVFDSPPVVYFEGSSVETLLVPELTVGMTVVATPVHNQNPFQEEVDRIDYVAPLKDAVISVNDIGAIWLTPLDGRWDGVEENLAFRIQGLRPGLTQMQIKARNVFGRSSDVFEKRIYFIGLQFVRFEIDVKKEGINIQWHTTDETFGAQFDLYRINPPFGAADTVLLAADIQPTGGSEVLWRSFQYFDSDVEPGDDYRYFVHGHFTLDLRGESRYFETISKTVSARAMLPIQPGRIVSGLSPNPFSHTTTFSVNVPKSYAKKEGDEPNTVATGLPIERPTAVRITVYDVRGRLVKNVFEGRVFSQVKTFDWDGTDDNGETVASGVYFIRVGAGEYAEVKKVIIVR
ncbi:MAG: T9SS type A sorting domain-containing protein, partial [Candidatus Latescibacterota bacterium]